MTKAAIDHSHDEKLFRQDLINIAKTTLSSKVLAQHKQHFAELAVNAILRLRKGPTVNIEMIHLIKKPGGRLQDSYLDDGFILDKRIGIGQPRHIKNARILVANTAMDSDKIKVFGARVKADSTARVAELERAERDKMKAKVEAIKSCKIDCFINRQLIYDWPEQLFADAGVMAIEHADFEGVERLAFATGAQIMSSFDDPEKAILGHADTIEEIHIGDESMIRFSGLPVGAACTVILLGATPQILDEAQRSLNDAFCVLQQTLNDPRTVYGAGHSEMLMAAAVDRLISENIDLGKKAFCGRIVCTCPTSFADCDSR